MKTKVLSVIAAVALAMTTFGRIKQLGTGQFLFKKLPRI